VPGPTGATGPVGATGPSGTAGVDGATGATGPSGVDGVTGPTGPTGASGSNGADGATGATGPSGTAGADGATGPTGPAGINGATGATGPTGPSGTAGATGPTGVTGPSAAYAQASMPTGAPNGSVWLDTDATSTTIFEQCWRKAVVTAGTSITGVDDYSLTLAYTVGFEQVYLNGVLLVRAVDYTATDGTTITLLTATTVGDYVEIITTSTFVAANTYTQAQADARYPLNSIDMSAGKNKILNSNFSLWQRGTSLTYTSSGLNYLPDRFFSWTIGTLNITVSQQAFAPGTAPVAGYEGQFFLRNAVTSLSGQSIQAVGQRIEDVRTLAGQTATFSFWAKADASRTYTTRFIQNFGSGGSGEVQTSGASHSVTTSWQRFSVTVSVPSISGKTIGTNSYFQPLLDGPANTANTLDTWGWQLEAGSVATAFQTASGSVGGELALCQRYYYRLNRTANGGYGFIGTGVSTTIASFSIPAKVSMRTSIASLDFSNLAAYDLSGSVLNATTATLYFDGSSIDAFVLQLNYASAVIAQYRPYFLFSNTSNAGFIGFSAEL
jgi:hypothetical protein